MKSITKKIQKLLSLATSSNEHEAKAAADKAQELLVAHNLNLQSIGDSSLEDYTEEEIISLKKANQETKFTAPIVAQFFFVSVIKSRSRVAGMTTISFIGREENVEIAKYTYDFLVRTFKDTWKAHKKENKNAHKQSFYYGLYKGLQESLEAQRKKTQDSMALVLVNDPMLDKAVKKFSPNARNTKTSVRAGSHDDIQAGKEQGRNIKINRGLNGGCDNNSKYITA